MLHLQEKNKANNPEIKYIKLSNFRTLLIYHIQLLYFRVGNLVSVTTLSVYHPARI
jgi:hypothetical protein